MNKSVHKSDGISLLLLLLLMQNAFGKAKNIL